MNKLTTFDETTFTVIYPALRQLNTLLSDNVATKELYENNLAILTTLKQKLATNLIAPTMQHTLHYILCACFDEFFYDKLPEKSGFFQSCQSLFHQNTSAGEDFFNWIDSALENPIPNNYGLNLALMVLNLGFKGKFAKHLDGEKHLTNIKQQIITALPENHPKFQWLKTCTLVSRKPLKAILLCIIPALIITGSIFFTEKTVLDNKVSHLVHTIHAQGVQ